MDVLIEVGTAALGFRSPPVAVEATPTEGPRGWSIHMKCALQADVPVLVDWASSMGARRVDVLSNGSIRAVFASALPGWSTLSQIVEVKRASFSPGRPARFLVEADRPHVQTVIDRLRHGGASVGIRHVSAAARDAALLTPRQREVLSAAVRAGYYDIPRPINLHALARQLGASAASVSERLRLAEARVIRRYVDTEETAPLVVDATAHPVHS